MSGLNTLWRNVYHRLPVSIQNTHRLSILLPVGGIMVPDVHPVRSGSHAGHRKNHGGGK